MRHLIAALIMLVVLGAAGAGAVPSHGDVTVTAEGYGLSRDDAILKAKRAAVEKGIGTVLISQTEMENFVVQKDLVLTRTVGAVKRFDVLEEKEESDQVFFVRIRAVVSLDSIKEDLAALKILLESMDKPRIMVVIQEEAGNVAESVILDYLNSKEFDLVDPAAVAALMQKETELIRRAADGDAAAAAQIGAENGAEYVIVGRVIKDLMENSMLGGSGMKSGQANITARVVNCSTAQIIAAKTATGSAIHVSGETAKAKAAEQAAGRLMDRALFEKIISSFQDMQNNGIPIDVTVENVESFSMQKAVRQALAESASVVSITKRKFGGGQLVLSVLYKGNIDAFAEEADGKPVKDRTMMVTDMMGSRVVIKLQ